MGQLKVGVIGGIILFVWGFLSWTVLTWHMMTSHQFQSDVAVSQAIMANAPVSGIYIMPAMQANQSGAQATGPLVFASVQLTGMPSSMAVPMGIGLLLQIVAATLVAWMLSCTNRLSYLKKVVFVVVVALTATLIKDMSAWNWMGFDTNYTLVMMADTLIGWLLAGLVMAKLIR